MPQNDLLDAAGQTASFPRETTEFMTLWSNANDHGNLLEVVTCLRARNGSDRHLL